MWDSTLSFIYSKALFEPIIDQYVAIFYYNLYYKEIRS